MRQVKQLRNIINRLLLNGTKLEYNNVAGRKYAFPTSLYRESGRYLKVLKALIY